MKHEEFLYQVTSILTSNDIPYVLFAGTLLAAVRDGKFLPSDPCDTDIAIPDSYYWQVRKLIDKVVLNAELKWYGIARKEITVKDNESNYKVDMFFLEQIGDKYAVYSYKPNPQTKKWDYEWRALFTAKNFFPSNTIEFLGYNFNVPNNYDEVLTEEYGNWKTPNHNWHSSDSTCLNSDKSYNGFYPAGIDITQYQVDNKKYDISYLCVNLRRKNETKKCIESLQEHSSNIKIYIADQDAPSAEMIQFYEKHKVQYYYVPYDCGLSYARNFLLDVSTEPYVMWGDNDFVFDAENNIASGLYLLQSYPNVGVVGGSVYKNKMQMHYERILFYDRTYQTLIYLPLELLNPKPEKFCNMEFYYCDLTFNYAIGKREIFTEKIRWNENVKVRYEHSDFFLRLKEYSEYRVVYFPNMKVHHVHAGDSEYQLLRNRASDAHEFAKYWNLKINFTVGQGYEIYGKNVQKFDNQIRKIENSQSTQNIIQLLLTSKTDFWLAEYSCLETVKYGVLKTIPVSIGVRTEEAKQTISAMNLDIKISVNNNQQTKMACLFGNYQVQVPIPVIPYLENYYKTSWHNIKKSQ